MYDWIVYNLVCLFPWKNHLSLVANQEIETNVLLLLLMPTNGNVEIKFIFSTSFNCVLMFICMYICRRRQEFITLFSLRMLKFSIVTFAGTRFLTHLIKSCLILDRYLGSLRTNAKQDISSARPNISIKLWRELCVLVVRLTTRSVKLSIFSRWNKISVVYIDGFFAWLYFLFLVIFISFSITSALMKILS